MASVQNMAYAGIQMFMKKLDQLIHCNDIPFFNNNPEIISQRPKFQLLNDDLGSMIQTLGFIHQYQHHLEKVNDLKKRFMDAAEEAQYIVDRFLSDVHNSNIGNLTISGDFNHRRSFKCVPDLFKSPVHIKDFNPTLNLDDVRSSLISLKLELDNDGMGIDLSPRPEPERTVTQSTLAPISISRNSHGLKKLLDAIVVGIDRDVELIRDKLVEDKKKVHVVSIVGMGGIGKTTLATKVFNDAYVKHHFYVRVWVTVSQTYDKRAVLNQILSSISSGVKEGLEEARDSRLHESVHKSINEGFEEAKDSRLRELVHKKLMGKRYLIVIDDLWEIEAWNDLKLLFPHDNLGSRIMITSRHTEVAKHASSNGLIHHLGYLNREKSWELLCHKVFHGHDCPEWSIKPGMKIVENCQGLPLVVVVIAGVLAKEPWSRNLWMEIAERMGSYIVGEEHGCLEILGLSYNHLPLHLRECFLYLGGFPEDYKFDVRRLIWLWVAEGFIEEDGNRSLEDIANGYLMDLIDRNLVIVDNRKSNGGVKVCKVHDLIRELCLRKAKEEQFILQTETQSLNVITTPYKPVRKFINTYNPDLIYHSTQNLRSVLGFSNFLNVWDDIAKDFRSFVLLRVLDLRKCRLRNFPSDMELLVHLRYLAIWKASSGFPSSICNLWNLQTLIYITESVRTVLPSNISDLVNLRHLQSHDCLFDFNFIEKPMHLLTISRVWYEDSFQKFFPCVKELSCITTSDKLNDFKSLTYLESLSLSSYPVYERIHITLPATLKKLTLKGGHLPWSDMSIIHSLPNLQVLKLRSIAFVGSCWNTDGQEFRQLKFLRLAWLNIKQWEAYSTSFPCLKQLEIIGCIDLEEIPLEIGNIPMLELIQIHYCSRSLCESAKTIQEEQQDMGNYNLQIHVIPFGNSIKLAANVCVALCN